MSGSSCARLCGYGGAKRTCQRKAAKHHCPGCRFRNRCHRNVDGIPTVAIFAISIEQEQLAAVPCQSTVYHAQQFIGEVPISPTRPQGAVKPSCVQLPKSIPLRVPTDRPDAPLVAMRSPLSPFAFNLRGNEPALHRSFRDTLLVKKAPRANTMPVSSAVPPEEQFA